VNRAAATPIEASHYVAGGANGNFGGRELLLKKFKPQGRHQVI